MALQKKVFSTKIVEDFNELIKILAKSKGLGIGDYIQNLVLEDLSKSVLKQGDSESKIDSYKGSKTIEEMLLYSVNGLLGLANRGSVIEIDKEVSIVRRSILEVLTGPKSINLTTAFPDLEKLYSPTVHNNGDPVVELMEYAEYLIRGAYTKTVDIDVVMEIVDYINTTYGTNEDMSRQVLNAIRGNTSAKLTVLIHSFSYAKQENKDLKLEEYLKNPHLQCLRTIDLSTIE